MVQGKVDTKQTLHRAGLSIGWKVRAAEALFLLLFPLASYMLLHPSPINQAGFLDPEIYTGYIHNISDLLTRYGLTYYSVRFGLILPARVLGLTFGFYKGYLILRYLLALTAGVPLYFLVKREFGTAMAVATYCALLTSPFLARALLWDYPDAAGVPYLLGGIALIALELKPTWAWDIVAGCLLGLAVHSNFFAVSILGLFLAVFVLVSLLHRRPFLPLLFRLSRLALGAVLATAVGMVYYYRLIGVWNILGPTREMLLWLSRGGMQQWRLAGFAWITNNQHVLILPIVALYALILGMFCHRNFRYAVFTLYIVAVTLYFYVYQFFLNADILQLFYYFSFSLPALFLALPSVYGELWRGIDGVHRKWLAISMATGFVAPWLSKIYVWDWTPHVRLHQFLALAVSVAIVLLGAAFVRERRTPRMVLATVGTLALGVLFDCAFLSPSYVSMFQTRRDSSLRANTEENVYRVCEQLIAAVPKFKDRPRDCSVLVQQPRGELCKFGAIYIFVGLFEGPPTHPGRSWNAVHWKI